MGRQGSSDLSVPWAEAAALPLVAVLPFEDLGGNTENDPFLSAMHRAIESKLTQVAELRVTSSASVRSYAGTEKSITGNRGGA